MVKKQSDQLLAVDIGGTKTEVALFEVRETSLYPLLKQRYSSHQADGIEEILDDFTSSNEIHCEHLCLGIAGIVNDEEAEVTNLEWKITRSGLKDMGFSAVSMINDMTAVAASVPLLEKSDLFCLQQGSGLRSEVNAILAPGTGLGQGFLLSSGAALHPRGSEGGHSRFAPADEEQIALLQWLIRRQTEPVSAEMVCAGPAIGTLYDFYVEHGWTGSGEIASEIAQKVDRTPIIVEAALADRCPVCTQALTLFLKTLGQEGASLVLRVYGTGGLYLGGGILPRLVGSFSLVPFLKGYHSPGPMAELLASTPIYVILKPDAALLGAANFGKHVLF